MEAVSKVPTSTSYNGASKESLQSLTFAGAALFVLITFVTSF